MAIRQGLRLEKSRRLDPLATDYGRYALTDLATGTTVTGRDVLERPCMTLAEAEAWLRWGGRR